MITWSLSLTANQIAVMKALQNREYGKPWDRDTGEITHWITGVRGLLKEGLIEHRVEMRPGCTNISDPNRSGQFLTARGRFILKMIEEDLEKFIRKTERPRQKAARAEKAA